MARPRQDFVPVDTGAHVDDAAPVEAREWSAYQLAIFRDVAEGRGHTVVLARAGSGKTTTILEALRHVPGGKSCLFVAFNKAIAEELGIYDEDDELVEPGWYWQGCLPGCAGVREAAEAARKEGRR